MSVSEVINLIDAGSKLINCRAPNPRWMIRAAAIDAEGEQCKHYYVQAKHGR